MTTWVRYKRTGSEATARYESTCAKERCSSGHKIKPGQKIVLVEKQYWTAPGYWAPGKKVWVHEDDFQEAQREQ